MQQPTIQFEKVSKSFGDEVILDEFDLGIDQGELVSIVGPSGCGKSTLLRIVAGLEQVDSGKLTISPTIANEELDNQGKGGKDSIQVNENPTAFVFQEANLLPWLNAFDNVALPYRITGRKVDYHRVREVLGLVGLPVESHRKYPAQLSGGMKMRVSIARALVLSPQFLLLDEPFAALDDLLRTSLNLKLMEIWQKENQTMLFVTHNIAEAIFVSQKIMVTSRGTKSPACLNIEFEYPRNKSIKTSGEFAKLYSQASEMLESCSVDVVSGSED